ncbi:MAG: hypothetical protein FWD01_03350 [Defluviitaleaceae bacterium]|nr:hypothetical protein [Defluviitaleaceae bacterium]
MGRRTEITITKHAKRRIKQRCGHSSERTAKAAFERGLKHSECIGKLKQYCNSQLSRNADTGNIRFYGNYVYVFSDAKLVTVFEIPQKYKAIVNKMIARKKIKKEE